MADKEFFIERNILKIGNQLLNGRREDLKEFDLTSNQSETLLFFDRHPGAMIYDLKIYMKISHQAARNLVERMKEKDLLNVTVSDTDTGARKVNLSQKGEKICKELKKKGTDVGGTLLKPLSEKEKDQLSVILEKIIKEL